MTVVLDAPSARLAAPPILEVGDARKRYGSVEALRGVSLSLASGEMLALLGPNGAGKTTLLRAIAGRVALDGGTLTLAGKPIALHDDRSRLGVVPQDLALYPALTARENLEVFATLHGVPRAEARERVTWALGWTALGDRERAQVRTFSGGMRRRLNIACGVMHRPDVVLLDEPTVGVDPQSRERIYDMLAELRRSGAALLLTTHQLDEAEERCDRVVIIDHGTVAASGTVNELVARTLGADRMVELVLAQAPDRLPEGFERASDPRRVLTSVRDLARELPLRLAAAAAAGLQVIDLQVQRRGLHDVFLRLTGKELRE